MFGFAMPGTTEMIIVAGVFVLLFGANALPKFANSLGKVLPSFKAGMREVEKETALIKKEMDEIKTVGDSIKKDMESI